MVQAPRPLSQLDLEKALATSRKTTDAAIEYNGLSADTLRWARQREPGGDYQVQAAINELSKFVVSHMTSRQPDAKDV